MTVLGEFTILSTIPNSLYASALTYVRMTSNPNVEPRTYAAAVTFTGFLKDKANHDSWDERHNTYMSRDSCSLVTDNTINLINGDIITDATGKKWTLESRNTGGPATTHYTLTAADPTIMSGGDREGGM